MNIPQNFIDELLSRTDVVALISRYVTLKKSGANYSGLCPFHSEKSPSFTVSPSKQFFHCFGCGKSGDAIRFLTDHTGLSFVEAVQELAQQQGMAVPQDRQSPEQRAQQMRQRQERASLTSLLEQACRAYQDQLKISPRAIAYLKGRGLTGEIAKRFGMGYAHDSHHGLASVFAQYDDPMLVECGLIIEREAEAGEAAPQTMSGSSRYDRFRDRIMFPIRNVQGLCIGFGGRVLGDTKPKYLNSPETPVFSKGRELYGLFEARTALRESGYAIVTEGYMDVVALAQWGFANAVATLGTACTSEHIQKLMRFTDSVVFSFDGDAAGRRAAHKALDVSLPHATDVRSIKFLFLPTEHDPDSFIRELGRDAFKERIDRAMPLSEFLLEVAGTDCDLRSAEGRALYASQARPLWQSLPEGLLKRQLLKTLAERIQLDPEDVQASWQSLRASEQARTTHTGSHTRSEPAAHAPRKSRHVDAWQASAVRSSPARSSRAGRRSPLSRADHVLRLLLAHMHLLGRLSDHEHDLLAQLPAPHGPALAWLEGQYHEHGDMPWGQLQTLVQASPHGPLAERAMGLYSVETQQAQDEAVLELRQLLLRIAYERKNADCEAWVQQGGDLQQLRVLDAERRALAEQLRQLG